MNAIYVNKMIAMLPYEYSESGLKTYTL